MNERKCSSAWNLLEGEKLKYSKTCLENKNNHNIKYQKYTSHIILIFIVLSFLNFIYFLYSRFSLVIYFIHISVSMSIPISQFITPPPPQVLFFLW